MEFKREHTLLHKLFIVDGVGKCGKSLMLDILSSFPNFEKQDYNSFLEYIPLAHKYNKISTDMAIAILQTEMDTELYNNMIGRYVNTRLTDDTSLYKYHSPGKYLKRALDVEGSIVREKVLVENPIYLCWSHDLINKSDIVFEAFQHKLQWIYINRKPIDIISEWNKQHYSERMAFDPTEMQYNIQYKDKTVPEIAFGWEEEFLNAAPLERTIKIIHTSFTLNQEALLRRKNQKNLHIFNFEDLVTQPYREISRLTKFIKNEPSSLINQILTKEKCPRTIDEDEFLERSVNIKNNISSYYEKLLSQLDVMYENIKQLAASHTDCLTVPNESLI